LLIPKRHGQTDGQTDGRLTVALPRSALASRGKKSSAYPATGFQCHINVRLRQCRRLLTINTSHQRHIS